MSIFSSSSVILSPSSFVTFLPSPESLPSPPPLFTLFSPSSFPLIGHKLLFTYASSQSFSHALDEYTASHTTSRASLAYTSITTFCASLACTYRALGHLAKVICGN
ncbi:hypothetical protein E2C01_027413 [Portunus trituberculatus]|uniref:Uncharacterized protein n=1 Tax=Portunus trituberculatus TaxID=210409 RepID=A0A5B7EHU2_PORTR|nr:hypothetical protein [Portunus trituberculatus]